MVALLMAASFQAQTQWETMAPMPTPRAMTANCVLDGKIYVMGGAFTEEGPSTNIVEVYDPVLDEWSTPIPNLPVALCGASAATVNGKIYVIGGEELPFGEDFQTVYRYDPGLGFWVVMYDHPIFARAHCAAAVIDEKVYIAGGLGAYSMIMFDPQSEEVLVLEPMQNPRFFLSAHALDGKLYAIGGMQIGIPMKKVEVYDPQTDSWTTAQSMNTTRLQFGSGVLDNQIYVFAGALDDEDALYDTRKYDPPTDVWTLEDEAFPEALSYMASAAIVNPDGSKCLYSIGGATPAFWGQDTGPEVSGAVYRYCLSTSSTAEQVDRGTPAILYQNYPNPFVDKTLIRYELLNAGNVVLGITSLDGKEVEKIFQGYQLGGQYILEWDARGLAPGVYLMTLQTGSFLTSRTLVIQ